MRLRVAKPALLDLDDIAEYTFKTWGRRQTVKYVADLKARFRWLAKNPYVGRPRDEIRPGLRSFPQGQHLVFYTIRENEVLIVGVPHGSMDLNAFFDRRGQVE